MEGFVGQKLGRYEIVALVGKGGMGEVFRARDTELGRDVAIKVLPAETATSEARVARFKREARSVAQLSHPNILDIHDFGAENGILYSVSELLEGRDLQQRLKKQPVPVSKALKIGRAVAEGLAAAHDKGIIHRDIKPANIFVSDNGEVKILDFGIAGLKEQVAAEPDTFVPDDVDTITATLTKPGQIVGTAAYMSPEQAAGKPADARSDIFSLGCVLYEMLAGRKAFEGQTLQQTMLAIVSIDPPPLTELRADIPFSLELLIKRCLEKEPGERFESARDVAFALEALGDDRVPSRPVPATRELRSRQRIRAVFAGVTIVVVALVSWFVGDRVLRDAPPLPNPVHLAILEFETDPEDPGLREVAAGLHAVLSDGLSIVEHDNRAFWVIPSDDADRLGAKSIDDFARVFEANVALAGRLERTADLLRLSLDPLVIETGQSLGEVLVEDSFSNVSSFQEDLVLEVSQRLGVPVGERAREYLESTATTMPEGFSAYVRGLGTAAMARDESGLVRAMELLESSVSLDPLFHTAKVALGQVALSRFEQTGQHEWLVRAGAEAREAISGTPRIEAAEMLLAKVEQSQDRTPEAIEALERAREIASSNADVRLKLAAVYKAAGRVSDAEREARRAVFLRPGYWPAHDFLAKLYRGDGDYVAAAIEFNEVISCAPRLTNGYNNLGGVLVYLGQTDEAKALFEQSIALAPSRSAYSNLGVIYFDEKRFADAAQMFERALDCDESHFRTWGNLGYAYRFGPAPEKADECFRTAVELVETHLDEHPEDLWAMTELAGFHAMLGHPERGRPILEQVVGGHTVEPELVAKIAETFEDLGDRGKALNWVAKSFALGISPSRFEVRPTLRELVADERYQELVQELHEES